MSSHSPFDPQQSSVWDHDTNQPYGRRTIRNVFFVALAIALVVGGVIWYVTGDFGWPSSDKDQPQDPAVVYAPDRADVPMPSAPTDIAQANTNASAQENNSAPDAIEAPPTTAGNDEVVQASPPAYDFSEEPSNPYEDGTARNGIFDFVGHLFGDMFDIDGTAGPESLALPEPTENASEVVQLRDYYQHIEQASEDDPRFRRSLKNTLTGTVYGFEGDVIGEMHDILINKETGKAKVLVFDEDEGYSDRDLETVRFQSILDKDVDGDIMLEKSEDTIEARSDNEYKPGDYDDYISLRSLEGGELLDFQGRHAGRVEHIIYNNGETQRIYLRLDPQLAPSLSNQILAVRFEDLNIVENPAGYDVQMSEEQTAALANIIASRRP